ncbi:MAG TPA: DUF3224 domain-containing protein [Candidatus Sulfopaludibacter sp.]|nr:DUF3224 domain-containing protein [Candidatus Sulfopaludibacter sp.]
MRASGTFEVKLTPQPSEPIGRMSLDKQYSGDLEAASRGEMLAFMSDVKGSAGYVAMERVTGSMQGRSGAFTLQHFGMMNRGTPELSVRVVPDSGTDGLAGIAGSLNIVIEGGKHSYEFEYTLPE